METRSAIGQPKLRFKDVALVLFVVGAGCAVFFVGILAADSYLAAGQRRAWHSTAAMMAVFLLEPVAIFVAVQTLLVRRRGFAWRDLGLRPTATRWVVIALVAGPLSLGLASAASHLVGPTDPTVMMEQYAALLAPQGVTLLRAASLLAVIGLLVPVAEEVLFRGIFYAWLRQRRGVVASVLLSSAVFAIAHVNAQAALQIFLIGLVLAYLYERSGSIVPSIVAHATVNVISLAIILAYADSAAAALVP
jgi:hypothetical protein